MSGLVRLALENGAVLLLHEDHANPSIAFRGSVRAGGAYGAPGAGEFAARLLMRGTRRRTAAKISDAFENIGAALGVANGVESASIDGRCTRETLRTVLAILTECLSEPSFPAAEVEKVRGEILGEIRAQQDDTRRAAMRRLVELVYPAGHPYRRDPKGDEQTVAKLTRAGVRAFHGAHCGAAGLVVAFSGDLEERTFRSTVAAAFEGLDAGRPPVSIAAPRAAKVGRALLPMPHKSQADFAAGRLAPARGDPDYYAVNLANVLFGRIGLYGRLGAQVRDNLGLAYYSFSGLESRHAAGLWYVSAGVNPKNLAESLAAIRAEMERLEREPLTDREIADGKEHLVGSLHVNLERNAEYASALHDIEYYGLGADFLDRYPGIVRGLDPDAVRQKAIETFDPDACSWVASGPLKGAKLAF